MAGSFFNARASRSIIDYLVCAGVFTDDAPVMRN